MRTLLVLCIFAVSALTLAGCNSAGKGVEVIIDGGGQFPPSLAGVWRSDEHGWEFVFEPDGAISSAVVTLGRVRVAPGKTTKVPMLMRGDGIYKPGQWLVAYSPESKVLTATIILDRIYIELGNSLLEGSSRDIFVGEVSEAGDVWVAEWTSFTKYTAHTPEYPNADLSSDQIEGNSSTLTFTKAAQENN